MKTHTDFHFRGSLAELDPAVAQLIEYKAERQYLRQRKFLLSISRGMQSTRKVIGRAYRNQYFLFCPINKLNGRCDKHHLCRLPSDVII
jgi:hypothetical protein